MFKKEDKQKFCGSWMALVNEQKRILFFSKLEVALITGDAMMWSAAMWGR